MKDGYVHSPWDGAAWIDVEVQDLTGRKPPGKCHAKVRTILIRHILLKGLKEHLEQIEKQVNKI